MDTKRRNWTKPKHCCCGNPQTFVAFVPDPDKPGKTLFAVCPSA